MPSTDLLNALRAVHSAVWDDDAGMVRVLPGMKPGAAPSELEGHLVRESALGAFLDLGDGHVERAQAAIDGVLTTQYDTPGLIWHGTFRKTAEQADPPPQGAIEWYHYDPNWRQFIGVIFAMCLVQFEPDVGAARSAHMVDAIALALEGEPPQRIADWYTNPNLMHAWLQGWYGQRTGDQESIDAALERASMSHARLKKYGDVDEYNSPTYDGIDLFAAGLWAKWPPTSEFHSWGTDFIDAIAGRLGTLYHPGLGAICGPHIRAYGLDLSRYVSLVGLWLSQVGEPTGTVLPRELNTETVHVHDLYFLPLFQAVSDVVVPKIQLTQAFPRQHEQTFDLQTCHSVLTTDAALGAERGRLPDFAKDQYVGATAHALDGRGETQWLGLILGHLTETIDGTIASESTIEGTFSSAYPGQGNDIALLSSDVPAASNQTLSLGPITIEFGEVPTFVESVAQPNGTLTRVRFTGGTTEYAIAVTPRSGHPVPQTEA